MLSRDVHFLSNHCRTLFISRFFFKNPRSVSTLQGCKVVFLVRPGFFDVSSFSLFFMTGGLKFPRAYRYSRLVKGAGRMRFDLDIVSVELFNLQLALYFWWRCLHIYMPGMDLADPRVDSFYKVWRISNRLHAWDSQYDITILLESMPELDLVVGRSYSSVRLFSSRASVRLHWSTTNTNIISHLSVLRMVGFVAFR
jgi:hypothetical protein